MADLAPGESIVIGRKPLRPLPADGTPRLDVQDPTKSMSKRHALFTVLEDGRAVLRDLESTNGTFVVRDNGDLSRMPLGQDFAFTRSPMRMQLGDMAIEFVRAVHPAPSSPSASQAARSLFSYAPIDVQEGESQPAGVDLSVDDILDLRTGEPTSAFQAMPKRKARHAQALPMSFPPATDEASNEHQQTAQPVELPLDPSKPAMPSPAQSLHMSEPTHEPIPSRDLFADARAYGAGAGQGRDGQSGGASAVATPLGVDSARTPQSEGTDASDWLYGGTRTAQPAPSSTPAVDAVEQSVFGRTQPADDRSTAPAARASEAATPASGSASAFDAFGDAEDGTAFKPVFEPGSVFERLSRGELKPKEPAVVIDGMSSDDARTTTDYNMQFQMARKRQLLPFLALNPNLYDDLYEFLESLEDPDIDSGLASNDGYADFKKGSSR